MKRIYLLLSGLVLATALSAAWFLTDPDAPPEGPEAKIDFILVEKSARRLTAYRDGAVLRRFQVALGREPIGPKRCEGDMRTPEGRFVIDGRLDLGESAFHRSLRVSYPRPQDIERARTDCRGGQAGGQIMLHGLGIDLGKLGAEHRRIDWTLGCIALTNDEIDWLYRHTANGVPIEIRP